MPVLGFTAAAALPVIAGETISRSDAKSKMATPASLFIMQNIPRTYP
jgi:hypothetical protein